MLRRLSEWFEHIGFLIEGMIGCWNVWTESAMEQEHLRADEGLLQPGRFF